MALLYVDGQPLGVGSNYLGLLVINQLHTGSQGRGPAAPQF